LNGLFRRAVQCRDQSVVNRLHDRSHPNKVSMKRRKKEAESRAERRSLYPAVEPGVRASGKRDLAANQVAGYVCLAKQAAATVVI
jgi:hypothetical protein